MLDSTGFVFKGRYDRGATCNAGRELPAGKSEC